MASERTAARERTGTSTHLEGLLTGAGFPILHLVYPAE
jgi:hypothetical protein